MDLRDRSKTILESSSSLPRALVVAVGVGLAFGAGVVVGAPDHGGATGGAVDERSDPVVAAAVRTKLYEERMKGVQLTWPKELTSFDPVLPAPPKSTPTKTTKPLSEEASSSPIVDKAVVAATAEPVVVAKAAVVEEDAGVKDDDVVNAPDPKRLDDAISKVLGEQKKSPTQETSTEKRYALQLASTGTAASAKVLADSWTQKGVKAGVVEAEVAGKGTMYRVRVAGIASRAAADALKAKLGQGLVVAD